MIDPANCIIEAAWQDLKRLAKALILIVLLGTLAFLLAGCESTIQVLDKVDFACVDITLDGPATESGLEGRGIILPEGRELDQTTIEALCEY